MIEPGAYLQQGNLEIWDITNVRTVESPGTALDKQMSWFPDGRRLAYVRLLPAAEVLRVHAGADGFGATFSKWHEVPAVFVYGSGESTLLHLGWDPVVSSDGSRVLVSDYDGKHRLVNVDSGSSMPVDWPGSWGPVIALLEARFVLYRGLLTEGAEAKWSNYGSPLASRWELLPIKVSDLTTGRFQTITDPFDPRSAVSYGDTGATSGSGCAPSLSGAGPAQALARTGGGTGRHDRVPLGAGRWAPGRQSAIE
jgi:hypothetical protein